MPLVGNFASCRMIRGESDSHFNESLTELGETLSKEDRVSSCEISRRARKVFSIRKSYFLQVKSPALAGTFENARF